MGGGHKEEGDKKGEREERRMSDEGAESRGTKKKRRKKDEGKERKKREERGEGEQSWDPGLLFI